MPDIDPAVLAERTAAVRRHLRRVEDRLPEDPDDLEPLSDGTDAVVLHLWQAVQVVIDLAVALCVRRGLGSPASYGHAFRLLAADGVLPDDLAERLTRAAGFRNLLVHGYADLDLRRVHAAASNGPQDLLDFLRILAGPDARSR